MNAISGALRAPLFYATINAGGTPFKDNSEVLLQGQMLAGGQAEELEPILLSAEQLDPMFGRGSMLASMGRAALRNAPLAEIWFQPFKDDVAGVAATGTLTVDGAPVANPGTLSLFIVGERIRIAVQKTQTDAQIATALTAAINKFSLLPVTATAAAAVITLTSRHKGDLGNTIEVDFGDVALEGPLAQQLLTLVPMAGGSGNPDILSGLAMLSANQYDWIAMPWSDETNLDRMRDFLSDTTGRWGYLNQLYGHAFTARKANYAGLQTLGATRNDQHMTIMGAYKVRSSIWDMVAATAAQCWKHLSQPPELSRPMQTIILEGIKGPLKRSDVLDLAERNNLYFSGIAGYNVRRDGQLVIDRLVTTYQTNEWGDPDATWLDTVTIAQITYGIRFIRQAMTNAHGRQGLSIDGETLSKDIATPRQLEATIIHAYKQLVALSVFKNIEAFKKALIVEVDATDANRVNVYLRMEHVNQLRIMAVTATSYLQGDSTNQQAA